MIAGEDLAAGARLLIQLPRFLRHRVSPETARGVVRRRLANRTADFLALMRVAVFERPESPYRSLLRETGCDWGDLVSLVDREGLEGALATLYCAGVYVTIEEFKGRRPIVRGATRLEVGPGQFRNPLSAVHVLSESSGSRGPRTTVGMDLAFVRDHAADVAVFLDARGGYPWSQALWGVPGGFAIRVILRLAAAGAPPVRWFSQLDPRAPELHPRYRWSARALRGGSLVAGVPLPSPTFAPLDSPVPVMRWMTDMLATGQVPHLFTFPSAAVRLCEAAARAGAPLQGVKFWLTGEPITPRRLDAIAKLGAEAVGAYGSSECGGPIAHGCLAPERRTELHLLLDLHALIQAGPSAGDGALPPRALLYSSLRATAPFVLLNVAIGDEAVVEPAGCACALTRLGWNTTLGGVRSYARLTAGGMSLLNADVVRALEEELPRRFGGGPTDYQVLEQEDPRGRPVVRLLVHPRLGALDAGLLAEAFLASVGGGRGIERVTELAWRSAGVVQVERREPTPTATGKIPYVQVGRPRDAPAPRAARAGG